MTISKLDKNLNIIQELSDRPNALEGLSAAELKNRFDEAGNIIKDYINNVLLVELQATTSGASGADKIGAGNIVDLEGLNLQSLLESLRNKLKSTEDGTSGADFVSATTIEGLNGGTVQTLLEALKMYVDEKDTGVGKNFVSKSELSGTRKLSASGDFTGSWFGVTNPAKSDPGIQGLVELHTKQLAERTTEISDLTNDFNLYKDIRFDIVVIGDSLSKGDDGQPYEGLANISDWLRFFTRQNVKNNGIWGDTLDGVIGRLQADVINLKPSYCIVLVGTNDISNGMGTNAMLTKARTIMETLIKNKIMPVFISIPPRNDNTTHNKKIREYNYKLEYQCTRRNCYFVDVYSHICTQDGSAKQYILSASDNLHWTSYGAYECAKIVSDFIPKLSNYKQRQYSRHWWDNPYENFDFAQFDDVPSGKLAHYWKEMNTAGASYSSEVNPNVPTPTVDGLTFNYQVINKPATATSTFAGISYEPGSYIVGGSYRTELDIDFEITDHTDDANTVLKCVLTIWRENGNPTQYHTFIESYGLQKAVFRPFFDIAIPTDKRKMLLEVYGMGKSGFKLKIGRPTAYLIG